MPRPTLRKRPKGADDAFKELVPYRPLDSTMDFYIPPVLESDFAKW